MEADGAFALEEHLVKAHGLILPNRCGCSFKVYGQYPGKPWYWLRLMCKHSSRWRRSIWSAGVPQPVVVQGQVMEERFDWFTGAGEQVLFEELAHAWDTAPNKDGIYLGNDVFQVLRSGNVYFRATNDDLWEYKEASR